MLETLITPTCSDPVAWLESNITLPPEVSPNSPGRLSLARQPWMHEILRTFLDPGVSHLSLVMGTQTGKSTLMLLGAALLATFDPLPLIWALPDDDLADEAIEKKLLPFFRANECLASLLPPPRAIAKKRCPLLTMPVYWTGARVPARLSARPAAYLFMDEAAKFRHVYRYEAHPIKLLEERSKAFSRRLSVQASTPNEEENAFWQNFLRSDQRHFQVPCPHCQTYQKLEFSRETVLWTSRPDMTEQTVLTTAFYKCPHCGQPIFDSDKHAMLAAGRWIPDNPGAAPGRRGYHLNSLYSAFVTFGQMAAEFWRSARDVESGVMLQNFYNSWRAIPYQRASVSVGDADVQALRGNYARRSLPRSDYHYIITCYDPGQERTHWVTTMVCPLGEMYVIDWGTLASYSTDRLAGTSGPAVHLDAQTFGPESIRPGLGYIDSGHFTEAVYCECEQNPALFPTKGTAATFGSWGRSSITAHRSLTLTTYSDEHLKDDLYDRIIKSGRGILHLPADADPELIAGLSGQRKITGKGWAKVRDDHYGDCVKLARLSWWVNARHCSNTEPAPQEDPSTHAPLVK